MFYSPQNTAITTVNPCIYAKKVNRNTSFNGLFPTHSLHRTSFILHLNENKTFRTIRYEHLSFSSNLIKGGKLYDNDEIAYGERGFDTYQTTRLRYGNHLQFYQTTVSQGRYSLFYDWEKGASQLRRVAGLFAHKRNRLMNIESIISSETKRISSEFGKSFLDCDDIVKLTGLGRDNVRTLMRSKVFPVIRVGNRQVVSIVAFVTWQMSAYCEGDNGYGKY